MSQDLIFCLFLFNLIPAVVDWPLFVLFVYKKRPASSMNITVITIAAADRLNFKRKGFESLGLAHALLGADLKDRLVTHQEFCFKSSGHGSLCVPYFPA